jgi:hypothetical protein
LACGAGGDAMGKGRELIIVERELKRIVAICSKMKYFDVILIRTRLSLAARTKFIQKYRRWYRKSSSRLAVFRK